MKVDKLKKLENDIFKMQDTIAESQRRLEALQQRYTQCRNDKILELYNKGKSVVEISKILGLGQGEVKLVIDLFKNAKYTLWFLFDCYIIIIL